MQLVKTLLGTTLIAVGFAATSGIALADGHAMQKYKAQFKYFNGKKQPFCKSGYKATWQRNTAWCVKKGQSNHRSFGNNNNNHLRKNCPAGSKPVKNHRGQIECKKFVGGNNQGMTLGYTEVEWTYIKGQKTPVCKKSGYHAYKRGNQFRCYSKGPNGWQKWGGNNRAMGSAGNRGYTEVEWTFRNGQKTPVCKSGFHAYKRGNQFRCYSKGPNGWQKWGGNHNLRMGGNGGNNGMRSMQKNNKYDKHRYLNGNNVKCKQGKIWFDRNFMAHCSS